MSIGFQFHKTFPKCVNSVPTYLGFEQRASKKLLKVEIENQNWWIEKALTVFGFFYNRIFRCNKKYPMSHDKLATLSEIIVLLGDTSTLACSFKHPLSKTHHYHQSSASD